MELRHRYSAGNITLATGGFIKSTISRNGKTSEEHQINASYSAVYSNPEDLHTKYLGRVIVDVHDSDLLKSVEIDFFPHNFEISKAVSRKVRYGDADVISDESICELITQMMEPIQSIAESASFSTSTESSFVIPVFGVEFEFKNGVPVFSISYDGVVTTIDTTYEVIIRVHATAGNTLQYNLGSVTITRSDNNHCGEAIVISMDRSRIADRLEVMPMRDEILADIKPSEMPSMKAILTWLATKMYTDIYNHIAWDNSNVIAMSIGFIQRGSDPLIAAFYDVESGTYIRGSVV